MRQEAGSMPDSLMVLVQGPVSWHRPVLEYGIPMILESAVLDVKPGQTRDFEAAFAEAQTIISSSPGYLSHELQRCMEKPNRYLLLVRWRSLEDHTEGFRKSAPYQEWKRLLHHFYDPFPTVEHYEPLSGAL